jgi:hypothetical protein
VLVAIGLAVVPAVGLVVGLAVRVAVAVLVAVAAEPFRSSWTTEPGAQEAEGLSADAAAEKEIAAPSAQGTSIR